MTESSHLNPTLAGSGQGRNIKQNTITESHDNGVHEYDGAHEYDEIEGRSSSDEMTRLERKLVQKVDLRLCTIAGVLCSLNLLDSGIISSVLHPISSFDGKQVLIFE